MAEITITIDKEIEPDVLAAVKHDLRRWPKEKLPADKELVGFWLEHQLNHLTKKDINRLAAKSAVETADTGKVDDGLSTAATAATP